MNKKQQIIKIGLPISFLLIWLGATYYAIKMVLMAIGVYGVPFIVGGVFVIIYYGWILVKKMTVPQIDIKNGKLVLVTCVFTGIVLGIYVPSVTGWYEPLIWTNKIASLTGLGSSVTSIVTLGLLYLVKS